MPDVCVLSWQPACCSPPSAIPAVGTEVAAAPTCGGEPATIVGTEGDDELRGTPGRDVIVGLGGDDDIGGVDGRDRLCGGPGDDRLYGGHHDDRLIGGPGDDFMIGGGGEDALFGDDGGDYLATGERVDGGSGSDRCNVSGDTKVRHCEFADLSVELRLPDRLAIGPNPMSVIVTNAGPDESTYFVGVEALELVAVETRRPSTATVVEPTVGPRSRSSAPEVDGCTSSRWTVPSTPGPGTWRSVSTCGPGDAWDPDRTNNSPCQTLTLTGTTTSAAAVEPAPSGGEPS